MTENGLAAFYRRYNERRFEDLHEFVARDVDELFGQSPNNPTIVDFVGV